MLNFNDKKGFICDMDGVIYHGNKILPGVPEFIDWLQRTGKEYLFLTNNSGCTPLELKQKLARMGLDVPEARFYTSALATAAFIRDQSPGCSAYVIGEAGLLNALYDAGITMNDVNPDYVIVGEGRNYSLDSLTNPLMMRTGLKRLGCHSAEAVMVGDRMDTDVISGMECGMSTVLVLSGISTEATLDEYAYRPSAVLDGVGDIVTLAEAQHAE